MATTDSNFFEIQRRSFRWDKDSTLDDGITSMLWDANPNTVVNGNTPGETKIYAMPPDAFFFQSTGELWFKTALPNTWIEMGAGNPFDQDLNTFDSPTFANLTIAGLLTDTGTGPLILGTAGISVEAGVGDVYTAGVLEVAEEAYVSTIHIHDAGIVSNLFVGGDTGTSITTGSGNLAIGSSALRSNLTGINNSALGSGALFSNTGHFNTAIGNSCMYFTTTGQSNFGLGLWALGRQTTGSDNVGIGSGANFGNQTGSYNVCLGNSAGAGVTGENHDYDVFIGYQSGFSVTTGSDNLFFGYQSGISVTTGSRNILFGSGIDVSSPTVNDELNIGNIVKGDLSTKVLYAQGLITDNGTGPLVLGTDGIPAAADVGDVYLGADLEVAGTTYFVNGTTSITRDGSNNLSFTDSVTGTKTLAELAAGGNPFDQDLNTNDDVQFNSIVGDSGPLFLGQERVPTYVAGVGDVYIGNQLEVYGNAWFVTGTTTFKGAAAFNLGAIFEPQPVTFGCNVNVKAANSFFLGDSYATAGLVIKYNTIDNSARFGVGDATLNLIVATKNYGNNANFGHGTSTDPTLWIHSAENPATTNTMAGYFVHSGRDADAGDFTIGTLAGDLLLKPATGIVRQTVGTSAPADADLANGEAAFWVDESGDTLEVKVKKSGGTVVSGTVAALA